MLQIMKIRNVAASKMNEDGPTRLLKFQLTDGQTLHTAVEVETIPMLSINTPPGTKVRTSQHTFLGS